GMIGSALACFFVCIFPCSEKVIENKAAASNCFLDQFYLFFGWIDTKTVGFMDEHRYSPSLYENVCSIISYRNDLYNVCKKTGNSLGTRILTIINSIGFQTVRQLR